MGRPETKRPAVSMTLDLLLRDLQADAATVTFPDLAPLTHQLEQHEGLARRAGVDLLLRFVVAELGAAANPGPYYLRRQHLTTMVQGDRPQQRWSNLIR